MSKENDLNSLKSSKDLRNYVEYKKMEQILDMIEECRRDGARNLFSKAKPKLRAWRKVVVVTALVRIVCFVLLTYAAFYIRYGYLKYMLDEGSPQDQRTVMAQAGCELLACCCILGVLIELSFCAATWFQIPKYICYLTAISTLLVFIILSCVALTANANYNPESLTIQLLGRTNSVERKYDTWHNMQTQLKCCGFTGSSSWTKWIFAEFDDDFYETKVVVVNDLNWMSECQKGNNTCTLPPSCCQTPDCYSSSVSVDDLAQLEQNIQNRQADQQVTINAPDRHLVGCVSALSQQLAHILRITNICAIVLAIFSFIMLILQNTIMLHHDSIGHINKKINKLDPARRDIFVSFFLSLDRLGSDVDLSQLSSIEEIVREEMSE